MDESWESITVRLSENVKKAIKGLGFEKMTPVQAATIPRFVQNKDVAVEAVTGSGKTLAFIIPLLEMLLRRETKLKKHEVGAIILTPTRELAIQIVEVLNHFLNYSDFSLVLFIGGSDVNSDIEKCVTNGCNIIIATPGRLDDMLQRKMGTFTLATSVKALEVLVLDEADRLLEMGFETSINDILGYLPKQRRTGLFSATQTEEVESLIRAGLRNPLRIAVKEKKTAETENKLVPKTPASLQNYYMIVEADEKFNQLIHFLRQHKGEKIMVFFSSCASVEYFKRAIEELVKNIPVFQIHGKLKQNRVKVIKKLKSLDRAILVCTDLMARGIDIPDISWVIQFDPPSSARSFVHRCGRTARIGNTGNALVMLLPTEDAYVNFLRINQRTPVTEVKKSPEVTNFLPKLKKLAKRERSVYESGMKAFVSFVQFYSKHECRMIFKRKELDLGQLATGYGLLKLPKMPELRDKKIENFQEEDVDVTKIMYKDKNREKARQEALKEKEKEQKKKKGKKFECKPWSKKVVKEEKRKLKREKRAMKRKRKKEEMNKEDLAELEEDFQLMKKLKKGKVSQDEFAKRFDEVQDKNEDKVK